MTTRISNNSPTTPNSPITNEPDLAPLTPQTSTAATTQTTTSNPPSPKDFFGSDDTCSFATPNDSKPLPQSTPDSKAQEFSVKDALLANPSSSTSATSTSHSKDTQSLKEMPLVQNLLSSLNETNKTSSTLNKASTSALANALENPGALHTLLTNAPGGSPQLANEIIQEMKEQFIGHLGSDMYVSVKTEAKKAQEILKPLIDSTVSRREFLTTITTESKGDPHVIQSALQSIGYPLKDAAKLAKTLASMHHTSIDPQTLNKADTQLQKLSTKLNNQLESLSGRMVSNAKNNNRFLTDPTFDAVKNSLLTRLNVVYEPPTKANELGKIINEATSKSKSSDTRENIQIAALLTTATVLTGGLASGFGAIGSATFGVGMTTMANTPEILNTLAAPDRLHASAKIGLSAQENADNAIGDRNANLGKMLAFTALGTGTSAIASKVAGNTASTITGAATNVVLQAGDLGYQHFK